MQKKDGLNKLFRKMVSLAKDFIEGFKKLGDISKMRRIEIVFFLALAFAFASYDLVILFFSSENALLLNVNVNEGNRIDESYMYLAGLEKFTIFDPYLKEHSTNITIRPLLPHIVFSLIYLLVGKHINLAIIIGHTIPPLFSAFLLFKIGRLFSGRSLSALAVVASISSVFATMIWFVHSNNQGGSDLYLLQELTSFGNSIRPFVHAPTDFARLYSPALSLPFLLLPLYLLLRGGSSPGMRGVLVAANLYVYPHQLVVLCIVDAAYFVMQMSSRKFEELRRYVPFAISAGVTAIPYGLQVYFLKAGGNLEDQVGRIGHLGGTGILSLYAVFFSGLALLLFAARRFSHWKDEASREEQSSFTPDVDGLLVYSLAIVSSLLLLIDGFVGIPQVHLFSLRIFVFVAPLAVVAFCSSRISAVVIRAKHRDLVRPLALFITAIWLVLIIGTYSRAGWVHRNEYASISDEFMVDIRKIPDKAVVMSEDGGEIAYISALTKKYAFVGNGIVSAASNLELVRRFAILALVYNWPYDQLTGESSALGTQFPVYHWIWHHGDKGVATRQAAFAPVVASFRTLSKCDLLKMYRVDFIRYENEVPDGLSECTVPVSGSFLRVTGRPSAN